MCVIRRHFRWVRADSGGNVFFAQYGGVSGGSQQSGGKRFFHEIRWPVWWVPAVRWRNHYFPRNKEALPCCGRGPSCQPLHVKSTSDGSHSLTTLTTPRREHQGGGRRRGLGRGRRGPGNDADPGTMRQWMPTRRGVRGFTGSLRCEAAVAAE